MAHLSNQVLAPEPSQMSADTLIEDVHRLIRELRATWDRIVEDTTVDEALFKNVILPLAHAENKFAQASHLLIFYASASPDPQVRLASSEASTLISDLANEGAQNESLFHLVDAVVKRGQSLTPEDSRLLAMKHRQHIRNGLLLPPGTARERLREIRRRISQQTKLFHANLADDDDCLWFSREDLDGVPQRALSAFEMGTGESEGKLKVTFRTSDLTAILRFAKRSEVRRTVFIANENRFSQNVALFHDVVVLRDEAARLLGYSSHASFKLEDRMAKTPDVVQAFLEDLKVQLLGSSLREASNLRELKAQDGEADAHKYYLWDHPYYNRMMLENTYKVDQNQVAEYFPLEYVVRRMLSIFEDTFGLTFTDITKCSDDDLLDTVNSQVRPESWHEDVQIFATCDKDDNESLLGYLYMDLYARTGKKEGPANFNLVPGFVYEDGTRQRPSTALLCSFSKPTTTYPCLLRHDEVYTLFHELGHGIHDLVSKTTYACFHGTEVAVDFGEAPSQMLEHWCWTPAILKFLGKHYSTLSGEYRRSWERSMAVAGLHVTMPPEELPDSMIDSLVNARDVNAAHFYLNQLRYGMFDMAVHHPESHEAIQTMDISIAYNEIRKAIFPPLGPETLGYGYDWGHGHVLFGHAMEEDYSAGYYSYLFSKVFAADMFESAFSADPMDKIQGRRYRYSVLEKGGSRDEMEILTEFLGRAPERAAFNRCLSLTA